MSCLIGLLLQRKRRFDSLLFLWLWLGGGTQRITSTNGFQLSQYDLHHTRLNLSSKNDDSNNKDAKTNTKLKGVYVRPSAVIERGSGFFVPGLEGPKVRLVVGFGLLVAIGVNHVFSTAPPGTRVEGVSIFYTLLLLLQGTIEIAREARIETIERDEERFGSGSTASLSQRWTVQPEKEGCGDDYQDKVEWSATTFFSLTPATHIMVLSSSGQRQPSDSSDKATAGTGNIDYWLGVTPPPPPPASSHEEETDGMDSDATATAAAASATVALETIRQSKGGRVALPANHPAAQIVPKEFRRCVIMQRINDDKCWLVASNDLLPSYTKLDLNMLGKLTYYAEQTDF